MGAEPLLRGSQMKTFEEDLRRLADIVEQVESSETPLDEAIALYKEGLSLAGKCGETLRGCEAEVQALQKSSDGLFTLEPFNMQAVPAVRPAVVT